MVFKFKEFSVKQDKTAMKISTDAVLLGAWTKINKSINSILDIGAGTGVIALQMAQLYNAKTIVAIEIEINAYQQCVENFENSPWSDRLFCYHGSFQEFSIEIEDKYDLIISNPPFYTANFLSENKKRNQARQTLSLSFEELLVGAKKLLSDNGFLSVIIPFSEENSFLEKAKIQGLFPIKITRVKGNINAKIKRSLILFTKLETNNCSKDELILEIQRNQRTVEYQRLVEPFYL